MLVASRRFAISSTMPPLLKAVAALLLTLLHCVVASLAKRPDIALIEEQRLIATMRGLVVSDQFGRVALQDTTHLTGE